MNRDEARAEVRRKRQVLDKMKAKLEEPYEGLYEAITQAADLGATYPELAEDANFSRGRIAQVIALVRNKRQAS